MSDRPWKAFEREAAQLIGGYRYWANSGAAVDVEGQTCVAQCKHVRALPLNALCDLAETAQKQGDQRFKAGLVIVKNRRGAGRKSTTLVVMTAATFRQLHGEAAPSEARQPE